MTKTALVYIDVKNMTYARYVDRECTNRFVCRTLLSLYWIEEIRNAPEQFQIEAPQDSA